MKKRIPHIIAHLVKRTFKTSDIAVCGHIIHKKLPPDLEERIRKFEPVFAEVYPKSHLEWLEGFQCDLNPESEVAVWEAMAFAFRAFLVEQAVILPAKKEAFGLLCSAAGTVEETLSRAKLRYLSRLEAEMLLGLYVDAFSKSEQPFSLN